MDRALLSADSDHPSLGQSLTRLHYLDDAFVPPPEWAELDWLIQEARHFHERRESKHVVWKWGPRQRLQSHVEHFLGRSSVKSAAILRILDERFLLLRGRATAPASARSLERSSWHAVDKHAWHARQVDQAPDVWSTAESLNALASPLQDLLNATAWLEPKKTNLDQRQEDFAHFTWHAAEVCRLARPGPAWKRALRAAEANRLTLISLEKLACLLRDLRRRLVQWDSGWTEAD